MSALADFVHLHLHTPYSLLDGFSKIDKLIERAKALGMRSVAITDHGVMFGAVEFYKKAKAAGLHPVIGCEVYTAARSRNDKELADKRSGHLVLLAQNQEGYQNLIHLVSKGFTEGFYYKPRIDLELLENHSKGLICLSACLGGMVQQSLLHNQPTRAKEQAQRLEAIFGRDNFFLELQDHGIPEQRKVNPLLRQLSVATGIPLVVTNDVHYVDKEDARTHEILLCVQTGKTLADADRMEFLTDEFYLKSPEQMQALFPQDLEALQNTVRIAERCQVEFDFDTLHLPSFEPPAGQDSREYFRALCQTGLRRRYDSITPELTDRLEYEMQTIEDMGYVSYFLIVWDFVDYARRSKIMVGPGRGSAAGSLVSYCLFITNIDPIRYQLLFERFLNPQRISMPDIDIDFCYEKREQMIEYVQQKYGKDHVSQIITFGTLGARAAVRDVGRVLGIAYQQINTIAREIPFALGMTIDKALSVNPALREIYESSDQMKQLLDTARSVEGLPRHASTHAAGVVIAKEPVHCYVPLYRMDQTISTQYTMNTLEELGLLKMDFLGLRTLTVIEKAIRYIEQNQHQKIDFTGHSYEDPAVFQLLSAADTLGVFQLEGTGIRQFLKELKPDNFEDIIAGISLYRPGPMESIPAYVRNKHSSAPIEYLHEALRPILSVTRGILVYQEQVMQIVRELGGFSYSRSDLLRRAMSKKKMDVMERERQAFVYGETDENGQVITQGCLKKGISETTAHKIYDSMIDFAKYAFNKSHAAAYAVLAYQTAWLKVHYPAEFMAALMSSVMGNTDKVVEYIRECERLQIQVTAPDVNRSGAEFSVSGQQIRYSLCAVKNLGQAVVEAIVAKRAQDGPYRDLEDLVERLQGDDLNKRALESLIKSGALDSLGHSRAAMMAAVESLLFGISARKKNLIQGQVSLFGGSSEIKAVSFTLPDIAEFSKKDRLQMEKEVLGLYLSGHPLDEYRTLLQNAHVPATSYFRSLAADFEKNEALDGSAVSAAGLPVNLSTKTTRNGQLMAFVQVEDMDGQIEVILFPKVLERFRALLSASQPIVVEGRLSLREEEEPKIVAQTLRSLGDLMRPCLYIRVQDLQDRLHLEAIEGILERHPGKDPIVFFDQSRQQTFASSRIFQVSISEALLQALAPLAGADNVAVKPRRVS